MFFHNKLASGHKIYGLALLLRQNESLLGTRILLYHYRWEFLIMTKLAWNTHMSNTSRSRSVLGINGGMQLVLLFQRFFHWFLPHNMFYPKTLIPIFQRHNKSSFCVLEKLSLSSMPTQGPQKFKKSQTLSPADLMLQWMYDTIFLKGVDLLRNIIVSIPNISNQIWVSIHIKYFILMSIGSCEPQVDFIFAFQ